MSTMSVRRSLMTEEQVKKMVEEMVLVARAKNRCEPEDFVFGIKEDPIKLNEAFLAELGDYYEEDKLNDDSGDFDSAGDDYEEEESDIWDDDKDYETGHDF